MDGREAILEGSDVFHGGDGAWELFFTAVASVSCMTKAIYGASIFGWDIVLE